MADLKLDGLTVASSSGSPTVVNLDSDVASRITAKGIAVAGGVFNGANVDSTSNLDHVAYSFGISGIIDTGTTGVYQVTLSNPQSNYIVLTKHLFAGGGTGPGYCDVFSIDSTTQFKLQIISNDRTTTTDSTVYFVVFSGS